MTTFPTSKPDVSPRRWLARGLAFVALQLAAAGAYFLRPVVVLDPRDRTIGIGAVFAVLALGVFAASAIAGKNGQPHPLSPTTLGDGIRAWRLLPILFGIVLLVIVVVWSANLGGALMPPPVIGVQFAVWMVGVGLIAWGSTKPHPPTPSPSREGEHPAQQTLKSILRARRISIPPLRMVNGLWGEVVLIFGVLLIALLVRLYGLDTQIRGLIDETIYINGILNLWDEPDTGLLTSLSRLAPTTAIYTVLNTGTTALFGQNFIGLRFINVVFGVAGIAALYGLARELFGRRIALVAALILATFPPHVHFSRIATPQLADTLFGTLALWSAARGLRTGSAADFARAGIALGLTSYFYEGGRLLFPALMVVWLLWLGFGRLRIKSILPLIVTFVLIAAPVYLTMIGTRTDLTRRLNDVGLNADYWRGLFADGVTVEAILAAGRRILEPLLVYVHQLDATREFYGGDQPMVLVIFVPFLLAGAGMMLAFPRRRSILLVIWALATAFGNALLVVTGVYPRFIEAYPALALLIAVGVCGLVDVFLPRPYERASMWGRPYQQFLLSALVIGIVVIQIGYYFGVHVPLFNEQFRAAKLYPDGVDAILRAKDEIDAGRFPPDGQIVLISSPMDNRLMLRRFWRYLTSPPDPLSMWRWGDRTAGISPLRAETGLEGEVIFTFDADTLTADQIAALPRVETLFFVANDLPEAQRLQIVAILGQFLDLQPSQYSPYDIPDDEEYVMYGTDNQR